MQDIWGIGYSGTYNYLVSLGELQDFRKSQGVTNEILRSFSVTEVYLRSDLLTQEEQEIISQDQKHSSEVAKTYYKKKLSRYVAQKGKSAMEKLTGTSRVNCNDAITKVIESLNNKGMIANPITLKNFFEKDNMLDEVGGTEYLVKLTRFSSSIKQAIDYH